MKNTSSNPRFLDPRGPDGDPMTFRDNDYRLRADSPCIDAGDNSLLDPPGLDMDGNLRIAAGKSSLVVDMGAYEYKSTAFSIIEVSENPSGRTELTWTSQPGDVYVIWSRGDLALWTWVYTGTTDSGGASTTWADLVRLGSRRFYRIEMTRPL